MLALTRKVKEQIFIGDNIVVTVVRSTNGSVRLGIDAPKNVRVVRGELIKSAPVPPVESMEAKAA